jgi:hypothetical protein
MKLKKLPLLIITILLFSCSRQTLFLKKRYSHGYRLLAGKTISENNRCKSEEKKHNDYSLTEIKANTFSESALIASGSEKVNERMPLQLSGNKQSLNYSRYSFSNKNAHFVKSKSDFHFSTNSLNKKKVEKSSNVFHQNKNDSDTELILLVILSLFPILSLVAVYL